MWYIPSILLLISLSCLSCEIVNFDGNDHELEVDFSNIPANKCFNITGIYNPQSSFEPNNGVLSLSLLELKLPAGMQLRIIDGSSLEGHVLELINSTVNDHQPIRFLQSNSGISMLLQFVAGPEVVLNGSMYAVFSASKPLDVPSASPDSEIFFLAPSGSTVTANNSVSSIGEALKKLNETCGSCTGKKIVILVSSGEYDHHESFCDQESDICSNFDISEFWLVGIGTSYCNCVKASINFISFNLI
jgi:hypothetical protein